MIRKTTENIVNLTAKKNGAMEQPVKGTVFSFQVNVLVICSGSATHLELSRYLSNMGNLKVEFSRQLPENIGQYEVVLLVVEGAQDDTKKIIISLANSKASVILICDDIGNELTRIAMQHRVKDIISMRLVEQQLNGALKQVVSDIEIEQKIASVVCIINGKSGSGTSFLTRSLGEITADLCDDEIALIDADLQHGALSDTLDLDASYFLSDALEEVDQLDDIAIKSMMAKRENLSLLASKSYLQLNTMGAENFTKLPQLFWKIRLNHDLVLVDLSRGLEALTLPIVSLSTHIIVVVQQSIVSLRETKALVQQLVEHMGINPKDISVVVNRYSPKLTDITVSDIGNVLNVGAVYCVSNNYTLAHACTELGSSILTLPKNKQIRKEITHIIEQVFPVEARKRAPGFFDRLRRRK